MKKPSNLGTYSKIGLAIALASVFLLGMVGVAGVAGATTPAGNTAKVNVTYVVKNDSDSAVWGGYWALDNYTKHLTIWQITAPVTGSGGHPGVYQVNATYTGTFCTFAGAHSPETDVLEPSNGCGIFAGGYDANITTYLSPINFTTPTGSPFNYGGTAANIILGQNNNNVNFDWMAYYFGAGINEGNFSYANNGNGWKWTYTLPNGNEWINSGLGNSGDAIVSKTGSGSVSATASITQTLNTCTVSPSSTGITFSGVVSGGAETAASPYPVTVQNTGNVAGELFLSGGDWYLNAYSGVGRGQINVSATQWQISSGPYAGSWYSLQKASGPQDTGSSIAPSTSASLYFQLGVPATVPSGTYGQTITLATSC